MKQLSLFVMASLVLAGCVSNDPAPDPEPEQTMPTTPEGTIRFLAIGDQGTGDDPSYRQFEVADTMHATCMQRGCDFVIALGDNLYNDGPNPSRGVYDQQFEDKFEKPYAAFDIPFYMVLGNHDNGNGAGSNPAVGDLEVAYHYREDRTSNKWQMPDRFYSFTYGDAEFFALDSGPAETSRSVIWEQGSLGTEMEAWYRDAMAKSTAKWKFGMAHHPYISNGQHGNAGIYDASPGRGLNYKLMLDDIMCGETDVFFAGHDHDMQWLAATATCDTEFIISGAAAKERARRVNADNQAYFEQYESYGFLWAELTGDSFRGIFIDVDGNELFERTITK